MTTPLITSEEYKQFANITGEKTDSKITQLILSSTLLVHKYLGYTFKTEESTETIITIADRTSYMCPNPVDTITNVVYNRRSDSTSEEVNYIIQEETNEIILLLNFLPPVNDTLTVTLAPSEAATEDIKLACMMLVQHYYKGEYNKTATTAGGSQIDYSESKSLPNAVRTILDFYREM